MRTLRSRTSFRLLAVGVAVPTAVALLPAAASAGSVHHLAPGQSLQALLGQVAPGDTVVLGAGTHPRQSVTARFASPVVVRGASRDGTVVQGFEFSGGASNLVVSDLTVTTPSSTDGSSALKVTSGAHHLVFERLTVRPLSHGGLAVHNWGGAPSDVVLRDSVVDGAASSGTTTARAVFVGDVTGSPSSGWPARVIVERNDMSGFWDDIVHVAGAIDMTVSGNVLHGPRQTDAHNDGLQSVASLRLRVVGNHITAPPAAGATDIPPDQGIMLGHAKPATTYGKVIDTYVANNLIERWRGKGVVLAGTDSTTLVHNTVVLTGPSTDRYAAPSVTVYGPVGAPQNTGVRIRNNALDRLWVDSATAPVVVAGNCVARGSTASDLLDPLGSLDLSTFALAATSPCRDLGRREAGDPDVDRSGAPRDAAPDAGAHEVQLLTAPVPTTSTSPTPTVTQSPAPVTSAPVTAPTTTAPTATTAPTTAPTTTTPTTAPTTTTPTTTDVESVVAVVDCPSTTAHKARTVLCKARTLQK